jgi:outer membrane protein assembly factor BamB
MVVILAIAAGLLGVAGGLAGPARAVTAAKCADADWTTYGRDAAHDFEVPAGCSGITTSNVATLIPKWFFHTGSAVTASPTVVDGVLYVGSWNGDFYALDAATGAQKWEHTIDVSSPTAFGEIVSSATVVPFRDASTGQSRLVVLFGGGPVLYALDAATGRQLAAISVDPRSAALVAKEASNPPVVEIESSPTVATVKVAGRPTSMIYIGMDVHNDSGVGPAGVIATELVSNRNGTWQFAPQWKIDPETDRTYLGAAGLETGSGTGYGCGDVWSTPSVDAADDLLVFGVGNCDDPPTAKAAGDNWSESITAVRADTGRFAWRYAPESDLPAAQQTTAAYGDGDFGATVNVMTLPSGARVAGDGSKDGYYYARRAATGGPLWKTLAGQQGYVQQDFAVGGFIGSSAVLTNSAGRATQIIGASAIPIPQSTADVQRSLWAVRALNPSTGAIDWTYSLGGPSYAATSVVNGIALVPETVPSDLVALNATTGAPLWVNPVIGPPSSSAVVVGNSVYLGTGTTESDLEYKSLGLVVAQKTSAYVGQGPLDPVSGVQAWTLP